MRKTLYICKDPTHTHAAKIQLVACLKKHRLNELNQKNKSKSILSTTTKDQLKQDIDMANLSSQINKPIKVQDKMPEITTVKLSVNGKMYQVEHEDLIMDIQYDGEQYLAAQTVADILYFNKIDQYLELVFTQDLTDQSDEEWLPSMRNNSYSVWKRQIANQEKKTQKQKQATQLLIRKYKNQEKTLKQKQKNEKLQQNFAKMRKRGQQMRKIRSKKMLAEIITRLPNYLLPREGKDGLLQILPTQIQSINIQHRNYQLEQFQKADNFIYYMYLTKKLSQLEEKQITVQFKWVQKCMGNLKMLLAKNIYDKRQIWYFHYNQIRQWIEEQLTNIWIALNKKPAIRPDYKPITTEQQKEWFAYWLSARLPIYNYKYCEDQNLIADKRKSYNKIVDFQNKLIGCARIKEKQPIPVKVYQSSLRWYQNLAHQLGLAYRQSVGLQKYFIRSCGKCRVQLADKKSKNQMTEEYHQLQESQQQKNDLRQRLKLQRSLKKLKQSRISDGFYKRRYLWNQSGRVYIFRGRDTQQQRQKQQRKNTYEMNSLIDPLCKKCLQRMYPEDDNSFIKFVCPNNHPWRKQQRTLRPASIGVSISVLSPTRTRQYQGLRNCGVMNNFHCIPNWKWMRRMRYSLQIPQYIRSRLQSFSEKTCLSIQENREQENYLPLQICDSIIPGAGKGIRTNVSIPANTIILSFVGVIKAHYQVRSDNQYMFSIGTLSTNDQTALIIDPVQDGNAAKFINSAAEQKQANCRVQIGMFTPRDQKPEPAVILISKQYIPAKHELFFWYGPAYWDQNAQKKRAQIKMDKERKQRNKKVK